MIEAAAGRSRRAGRQDLRVLADIPGVAQFRLNDEQVVVHLTLGERFADLGHELPRLQVPLEDLELVQVLLRGLADQIPGRSFRYLSIRSWMTLYAASALS